MLDRQPEKKGTSFIEVPSNTKNGVVYRIYFDKDGLLHCNCPAGIYDRPCKHKRSPAVLKWIQEYKKAQQK